MIYDEAYKMEKEAGFLGAALNAGKALLSSGKATTAINAVKKGYNTVAKAGLGKKMLAGAGIGAAMNAGTYDKNQDDGSFGKSRIGKALTGALGGAVGGAVAHKVLKPATLTQATSNVAKPAGLLQSAIPNKINVDPDKLVDAEYHVACDYINELYIEKKAKELSVLPTQAKNLFEKFKDLSPWQRMAIGAIVGAGTGAATFKKPTGEPKKIDDDDHDDDDLKKGLLRRTPGIGEVLNFADNVNNKLDKTRGGKAIKGANIGAALGYVIGNPNKKL
jgi:hypothetical protein